MSQEELLFCPLGGSGQIGGNMNLYAYGKEENQKWIIVDTGVSFADESVPGVDLIYPDPGFPIYESAIRFSGAKPVPYRLKENIGFSFYADDILNKLTKKTIIINAIMIVQIQNFIAKVKTSSILVLTFFILIYI